MKPVNNILTPKMKYLSLKLNTIKFWIAKSKRLLCSPMLKLHSTPQQQERKVYNTFSKHCLLHKSGVTIIANDHCPSLRVNSQHNKPFHTKYMRQNKLYNKLRLLRRFQLNDFSIRFYQHTQKFKLNFMISELTMWVKGLRWKGTSFSTLGRGMCLLANSSYFRSKTWVIATMPKAASLTLKWSIVTKSWKKGRISSILSSSHWFRNSMALKQKKYNQKH